MMENTQEYSPKNTKLPLGQIAFLLVLVTVGATFAFMTLRQQQKPDISEAAKAYLDEKRFEPLSGSLQKLLREVADKVKPTQPHPLLGRQAPDFELAGPNGERIRLSELVADGPVVLVFYYGYQCDHCVAQIFALECDLGFFRQLGAKVVALSPDRAAKTKELKNVIFAALQEQQKEKADAGDSEGVSPERMMESIRLLSDADMQVATEYGAYEKRESEEDYVAHATFVVDSDRIVRWAQYGEEPFVDNGTLVYELARIQGRLQEARTDTTRGKDAETSGD